VLLANAIVLLYHRHPAVRDYQIVLREVVADETNKSLRSASIGVLDRLSWRSKRCRGIASEVAQVFADRLELGRKRKSRIVSDRWIAAGPGGSLVALLFALLFTFWPFLRTKIVFKDGNGTRSDHLSSLADDLLASRCPEICGTKRNNYDPEKRRSIWGRMTGKDKGKDDQRASR